MRFISEEEVFEHLPPHLAVQALRQALIEGYDPADDFQRQAYEVDGGQMLTMPSTRGSASGIKVLAVSQHSKELKVPRIQGNYLLFDGKTLAPSALIDGAALTSIRTPAASFAGILDLLVDSKEPLHAVIFGTGPQGAWHEKTLREVCANRRDVNITYVSRTRPADPQKNWRAANSPDATAAIAGAELILCCTTASSPLIGRADVRDDAIIVAVGSHTAGARELGADLMGAAQVMVEDLETARKEAGDVVLAVEEGALTWDSLLTMRQVVTGQVQLGRERPIVFKTTGMGWEDLVLAEKIAQTVPV